MPFKAFGICILLWWHGLAFSEIMHSRILLPPNLQEIDEFSLAPVRECDSCLKTKEIPFEKCKLTAALTNFTLFFGAGSSDDARIFCYAKNPAVAVIIPVKATVRSIGLGFTFDLEEVSFFLQNLDGKDLVHLFKQFRGYSISFVPYLGLSHRSLASESGIEMQGDSISAFFSFDFYSMTTFTLRPRNGRELIDLGLNRYLINAGVDYEISDLSAWKFKKTLASPLPQ